MKFPAGNRRLAPGYRFHPTVIELIMYYLLRKVLGEPLEPEPIIEVEIYQYHPEDLRGRACKNNGLDLYFFCARGKKYVSGDRTNRATPSGYWKATGKDKVVFYRQRIVGKIKHLVFHEGKPPKGTRTDWVMHEYRLEDSELAKKEIPQDAFVLCKIFKKDGLGPRNREQLGSLYNEEDWDKEDLTNNAPLVPIVDQAPALTPNACNVASTSKAVVSNSDIASTSEYPVQKDDDDDEITAMLEQLYVVYDAYGNLLDSDLLPP